MKGKRIRVSLVAPTSCHPNYRLRWTQNGKRRTCTAGTADEEEARRQAVLKEEELAAGKRTYVPLTVSDLFDRWWKHVETVGMYCKNGEPTGFKPFAQSVKRSFCETYGDWEAAQFGPLALGQFQESLVAIGNSRLVVNAKIDIVRRVFGWGVSRELVAPEIAYALQAVRRLRRGQTRATEPREVHAVPDEVVDATLPHLPPVPRVMVQLQRLLACRPGEICIMRPADIVRTEDVWQYTPQSHKAEAHDSRTSRTRPILIGPQAQEILRPYLLRPAEAYCFPAPRTPNAPYRVSVLRKAIYRAADRAGVERWHPHQLRHSRGDSIKRQFGAEAARLTLRHRHYLTTEIYTERDDALAEEVALKTG